VEAYSSTQSRGGVLRDGEPQAATNASRTVHAVKRLEHPRSFLGRNTRARINNLDYRIFAFYGKANGDLALLTRIVHSVIQGILEDQPEGFRRGGHDNTCRRVEPQIDAALLGIREVLREQLPREA
jgi:hypothetical protein